MPPLTAVIVHDPTAWGVTSPVAETFATPVLDDVHVTHDDKFWVEVSVYVPVAVNCWDVPKDRLRFVGVKLMEARVVEVQKGGSNLWFS
jgi:hypothetical protein